MVYDPPSAVKLLADPALNYFVITEILDFLFTIVGTEHKHVCWCMIGILCMVCHYHNYGLHPLPIPLCILDVVPNIMETG
jgi:hypothetical protein